MDDEAAHLGKTLALAAVSEQTLDDMSDLLSAADSRLYDLAWQNDKIGEAAVINAVYDAALTVAPPERLAGS